MNWLRLLMLYPTASLVFCVALGHVLKTKSATVPFTPKVVTLAWCPSTGADGYVLYMGLSPSNLTRLVLSGVYLGQTQIRFLQAYPEMYFSVSAFRYEADGSIVEGAAAAVIANPCAGRARLLSD